MCALLLKDLYCILVSGTIDFSVIMHFLLTKGHIQPASSLRLFKTFSMTLALAVNVTDTKFYFSLMVYDYKQKCAMSVSVC